MGEVHEMQIKAVDCGHLIISGSCFQNWHRGVLGNSSVSIVVSSSVGVCT